jgi:hypothetical protein
MGDIGLDFGDPRWPTFSGGYKIPYDPRPALRALAEGRGLEAAWNDLWENLHHQGDIGEASFAAIPHLVRIHERWGVADWNAYALAAIVELARDNPANPVLPPELHADYMAAWGRLADVAYRQFADARDDTLVRGILGVLAIARGQRTLGRLAVLFTEDELKDIQAQSGFI